MDAMRRGDGVEAMVRQAAEDCRAGRLAATGWMYPQLIAAPASLDGRPDAAIILIRVLRARAPVAHQKQFEVSRAAAAAAMTIAATLVAVLPLLLLLLAFSIAAAGQWHCSSSLHRQL